MASDASDVTLIIPTYARSKILSRTLAIYASFETKIKFIVVDASENASKKLVETFKAVEINYLHRPKCSVFEGIAIGLKNCETKYAAFCGDDDIFFDEAVTACVLRMEKMDSVGICSGHGMFLKYSQGRALFASGWYTHKFRKLYDERKFNRLENFARGYFVLQFGVGRLDVLKTAYCKSSLADLDYKHRSAPEIAVCLALSYLSKFDLINEISFLRGLGDFREGNASEANKLFLDSGVKIEEMELLFSRYFDQICDEDIQAKRMTRLEIGRAHV